MPALLVTTMPSGSTRLTVASLYSFPVTVLKSSACATEMNDRIRKLRSFICIRCFDHRHSAVKYSFPARKIAQIPAHTVIEQLEWEGAARKNPPPLQPARLPLQLLRSKPLRLWT